MTQLRTRWLLGAGALLLVACTESTAPPAATQLAFTVQPRNGTAGIAISPAVSVAMLDASGNTVTSATGAVAVALGANPGGAMWTTRRRLQ